MLNDRLDRGVRCEGEDSKYIDGLSIWPTPENMTAGKRYKRNWPRKATSGLSDCSQAIESAQRSMSIAQRAGKPCRHQPKHPWFLIESFCRRIQFTSPACSRGVRGMIHYATAHAQRIQRYWILSGCRDSESAGHAIS